MESELGASQKKKFRLSKDEKYTPAWDLNHQGWPIVTITDQNHKPYPSNIRTACYYGIDWINPEVDEEGPTYSSWNSHSTHNCLLPCLILNEKQDSITREVSYTAQLIDKDVYGNTDISWDCHIWPEYEYIYTDIPRSGIIFVNKPYTSDTFLTGAFRQPIGVPDGFYPGKWLRNKLRGKITYHETDEEDADSFKRRNILPRDQQSKAKKPN